MYYPMMVDLSFFKILVVGGGKIAYQKTKQLVACGGKVTVLSLTYHECFETFNKGVEFLYGAYEEKRLKGFHIIIAATDDKACNEAIGLYCKKHHLLCNVVTSETLSSFIVPSSVRRGDLILSVSTSGKSPALARQIKETLEKQYEASYEAYVARLGELREEIKEKVADESERKRLLNQLITLDQMSLDKFKLEES